MVKRGGRLPTSMRALRRLAVGLSCCLALAAGGSVVSLAEVDPSIAVEGTLESPAVHPMVLDRQADRLYAFTSTLGEIAEFDLSRPPGRMFVRLRRFYPTSARLRPGAYLALDEGSRKLYLIDDPDSVSQPRCVPRPAPCATIRSIDLNRLELTDDEWNLSALVPGFSPLGMTYDERDRRLYVLGTFRGFLREALDGPKAPVAPIGVVALDVDLNGPPAVAWVRVIKTCTLPLLDIASGAPIFRSARYDALYFGCSRADSVIGGMQLPGHVGVVRLWFDPRVTNADLVDPQTSESFREDFYRASGSFGNASGFVSRLGFDKASERFVMVSNAANTAGVWVFDGILSAWVGFVLSTGANLGLGLEPLTGTMLVKDGAYGFNVVDVRSTPASQGVRYSLPAVASAGDAFFDGHGRMFWNDGGGHVVWGRVPPLPPRFSSEVDYDSITQDVDEGPDTQVTFAGSSAGFGARMSIVGGSTGLTAPFRPSTFSRGIENKVGTTPFLSGGDRGFELGQVSSLDVRETGAQAAAQAVTLDDNSSNDERTIRGLDLHAEAARDARFAAGVLNRDPEEASRATEPLAEVPDAIRKPLGETSWPWEEAFCIDGGGAPQESQEPKATDPQASGHSAAVVTCSLAGERAHAFSRASTMSSGPVSIGEALISSDASRLPGRSVVESHAVVRDVDISLDGAGSLRFARVTNDVVTVAGGRPGTAQVEETRAVQGVELRDAEGKILYECGTTCDVNVVAAMVNQNLGGDMRMTVPVPEIIETPGGAFAGFRERSDRYVNDLVMNNDASRAMPAIEIELFHEYSDKSRTVIQLAAIDSSSLYGITLNEQAVAPGPPIQPGPDPGPTKALGTPPGGQASVGEPVRPPVGVVPTLVQQALFLVRSPGQALSMLLVVSLLLGFGALSRRRRALGGIL